MAKRIIEYDGKDDGSQYNWLLHNELCNTIDNHYWKLVIDLGGKPESKIQEVSLLQHQIFVTMISNYSHFNDKSIYKPFHHQPIKQSHEGREDCNEHLRYNHPHLNKIFTKQQSSGHIKQARPCWAIILG